MQSYVSPIWRSFPTDLVERTERCIHSASKQFGTKGSGHIFFRADDVAAPGRNFAKLMDIFRRHRVPLCLAVVPAWLTGKRWQYLKGLGANESSLWCWHQHGWRHANHEVTGKKQEFGEARSTAQIIRDLTRGKRRLENIMTGAFYPVFTPPWNRCSARTLQALKKLGYEAVSRSSGGKPPSPAGLPDICVNVDLHTRREKNPAAGWQNLLGELEQAAATGFCGIMIHHQLMNDAAFDFLEILLKAFTSHPGIHLFNFKDMVERFA